MEGRGLDAEQAEPKRMHMKRILVPTTGMENWKLMKVPELREGKNDADMWRLFILRW
jgi:hypothetical protein